MNELIEVAFENTSKMDISKILKEFFPKENLIECTFSSKEDDVKYVSNIEALNAMTDKEFNIFIKLKELNTDFFFVTYPSVNIIKYDGKISFAFIFNLSEFVHKKESVVKSLAEFSKSFAKTHSFLYYYCGIEPAEDIETRFFTNEEIGPLDLK